MANWKLALQLGGSLVRPWNWAGFEALPQTTIKSDIHCVTKWFKLDTIWQGVALDNLLNSAGLSQSPEPYRWLPGSLLFEGKRVGSAGR